jgi:hypothetical protein
MLSSFLSACSDNHSGFGPVVWFFYYLVLIYSSPQNKKHIYKIEQPPSIPSYEAASFS